MGLSVTKNKNKLQINQKFLKSKDVGADGNPSNFNLDIFLSDQDSIQRTHVLHIETIIFFTTYMSKWFIISKYASKQVSE